MRVTTLIAVLPFAQGLNFEERKPQPDGSGSKLESRATGAKCVGDSAELLTEDC